jgi:hypothetical protein
VLPFPSHAPHFVIVALLVLRWMRVYPAHPGTPVPIPPLPGPLALLRLMVQKDFDCQRWTSNRIVQTRADWFDDVRGGALALLVHFEY